eukprot:879216-Amorphochlora_amoeboformis.AAC.1
MHRVLHTHVLSYIFVHIHTQDTYKQPRTYRHTYSPQSESRRCHFPPTFPPHQSTPRRQGAPAKKKTEISLPILPSSPCIISSTISLFISPCKSAIETIRLYSRLQLPISIPPFSPEGLYASQSLLPLNRSCSEHTPSERVRKGPRAAIAMSKTAIAGHRTTQCLNSLWVPWVPWVPYI